MQATYWTVSLLCLFAMKHAACRINRISQAIGLMIRSYWHAYSFEDIDVTMHNRPTTGSTRHLSAPRAAGSWSLACVIALLAASGALAQSGPGSFTLPEPTPTPTPAPQGPVDVKSGVPIAPRSIPEQTVKPPPAPAASQAEPQIDIPVGQPNQDTGNADAPEAVSRPPANSREQEQPARNITPLQGADPGTSANTATQPAAPTNNSSAQASSPQASSIEALDNAAIDPAPTALGTGEASSEAAVPSSSFPGWLWAAIALGLAIVLGAFAFFLRTRKARALAPASVLAKDTLPLQPTETAENTKKSRHVVPAKGDDALAPSTPAQRPLHVEFDVVSATRSLMMLTLECRVSFSNRSDHAARDIVVSGSLVCAQRSATGSTGSNANAPTQTIERIGPQQSRAITMQLQLPLSEIQPIRQGEKPLCIPLAQVAFETHDNRAETHSFVIGSPSLANTNRLHPIPLDTPPGGIAGLLARAVKADGAAARAA